jgi:hypothetical protein
MIRVSLNTITTGILLGAPSLAAAHGGSHTQMTPMHFLTSLDHLSVFALVAAGAGALITRYTIRHLRKAPVRKK